MAIKQLTFVDNNAPQCDAEWLNSAKDEVNNAIEKTGQTLSVGDRFQLAKAIKSFLNSGSFHSDSGVADAYVLTTLSPYEASFEYSDGMKVRFRTSNANTGASTANVDGIGVKSIKKYDPDTTSFLDTSAGDIPANFDIEISYDLSNDYFVITNRGLASNVLAGKQILGHSFASTATYLTTTNSWPNDNTIPQQTEGAEALTLTYDRQSNSSKLIVLCGALLSSASNVPILGIGLFQDAVADALSFASGSTQSSPYFQKVDIVHYMDSVATGNTTLKMRFGANGATAYLNGTTSARFGGAQNTYMLVVEVEA